MSNRIFKYELSGAFFSIIIGSVLHFIYGWSGKNGIVAIFGAVNESTWEHLKIAFWPTLMFSTFEYFSIFREAKNFCLAQLTKLVSIPIIIVALFYGWLALFPDNFFWDIGIFIFAIITAYYISSKLMSSRIKYGLEAFSAFLIVLMLATFAVFTYFPPQYFIFKDPISGDYGLERK